MKRILTLMVCVIFAAIKANAQEVPAGYQAADSLVYVNASTMDKSLVGQDVFNGITVHQSQAISSAMKKKIEANKSKKISGFRVRIFFDNKQDSRNASESALNRFKSSYPGFEAYRSYSSPYFKVTAGNFRTKSEAMQFLQSVKIDFPGAIVVKENIDYPIVDRKHSYMLDTITVYKPRTVVL